MVCLIFRIFPSALLRLIFRSETLIFLGVWRDKLVFSWDYRSFNTPKHIEKAASDLFPRTPTQNYQFVEPAPAVERPYPDLAWLQIVYSFDTCKRRFEPHKNQIGVQDFDPPHSHRRPPWSSRSAEQGWSYEWGQIMAQSKNRRGQSGWYRARCLGHWWGSMVSYCPDCVFPQKVHQCFYTLGSGLQIAARLKALGVNVVLVERNQRIGDNWRNRYEYLSLHLPHWADHFAYFPFPERWPTYTPAGKMGDWLEWYAQALELTTWTDSNVTSTSQKPTGEWEITVERNSTGEGRYTRVFHPKDVVMATSFAGVPFIPDIPGIDKFKGIVRHSTEHHSSREWVGKKVLVVGTSSSGFDTAFDFARRGIDVTLLQRSPAYIMSLDESVPRVCPN